MLYDRGESQWTYAETINAVTSRHEWLKQRGSLPASSARKTAWQNIEPGTNHNPIPAVALLGSRRVELDRLRRHAVVGI